MTKIGKSRIVFAVKKKEKSKKGDWIINKEFPLEVGIGPPAVISLENIARSVTLGSYSEYKDEMIPFEIRDASNNIIRQNPQHVIRVRFSEISNDNISDKYKSFH